MVDHMQPMTQEQVVDIYGIFRNGNVERFARERWDTRHDEYTGTMAWYSSTANFVLRHDDGKFYPVRVHTFPVRVHTFPDGPGAVGRTYIPSTEGFDTLEQATLWWDTCSQ